MSIITKKNIYKFNFYTLLSKEVTLLTKLKTLDYTVNDK